MRFPRFRCFKIPEDRNTQQYNNSFFVRTVVEWNAMDNEKLNAGSVDAFNARLKKELLQRAEDVFGLGSIFKYRFSRTAFSC